MTTDRLYFASDYQEGVHPLILRKLTETNMEHTTGYGTDPYCESARERIREACACPEAKVQFLVGGTQTNATVITALLRGYEGVIAADSGHIAVHEAGAIEAGGHKVLTLPGTLGKISAAQLTQYLSDHYHDGNCDHLVQPGMVYLSQPTEYGTLYSLQELKEISEICSQNDLPLFVDGARLAYALASPENDVTLPELCSLCDVFYIGGTKCGAFLGEAVVIRDPKLIPHFFTSMKRHGALLAKGRLLGIQFDELFRDDLYFHIGKAAIAYADRIKKKLTANGVRLFFDSPTNQIFFIAPNDRLERLREKVEYSFGEKYDERHSVIRFATGWATTEEDVERLLKVIDECLAE